MDRKTRTRQTLLATAFELFSENGYEATTTATIAARAGVSEMTLFRHFPSKSSLVVDDPYDPVIAAAIYARPAEEAPLSAAARGVRDAWAALPEPAANAVRERLRIVADTPSLRGALARASQATEEAIATALQRRDVPRASAHVVGAATVAGLNAALLDWARGDDATLATAIETAVCALEGES